MSELRFDGRVAIVTGAGGGLGRQHALTLAARGCKVVVNDLGGSAHGDGKSSSAADKVVEEIRAAGGEAVANYDSVENGAAIVKTAIDAFGTVDIVINNAGILRDVTYHKMTQGDWDLVLKVHLMGAHSVTYAAWPIMRDKGYGRVIMTTSAAGIYGNFGQANYSAAKLGMVGLANTLALEGGPKGIHVNTIAPIAASRLTATILPPEVLEHLQPEAVSPLVAWLCHESCEENHGLFEVGAGYIGKLRWERTIGHSFVPGRVFSMDEVAAKWDKITDFKETSHPANVNESMAPIMNNISNPPLGGNEFIDLDVASKAKVEVDSSYDERDLSLYALGIGAAQDPLNKGDLAYVYELGGGFQAFPTYGVMPQMNAMLDLAKKGVSPLPGMNFGFDRLLHGEQYTEIKRPLPPHAKLHHTFTLKHAYDKDPNAVVTFAISSKDENGEELIYNEMTAFIKGAGGWGGDRGPSGDINLPPDRKPDAVVEEKIDDNQTLLYRLSGDWNPLHADPEFAKAFGYDRPILHGLCTFGYCARHVLKSFANNDGRYFKSIKVRFAKNVFPGETLVTKMWKENDGRIVFETSVKERNEVVIKNAAIELYKEIPKPASKPKAAVAAAPAAAVAVNQGITADDLFTALAGVVSEHPELVDKVKTVFQFHIKSPDSDWYLDLKNGKGVCAAGVADKADVTLEVGAEHLDKVMSGDLAVAQKLFFGGQLKISGNVMASNKLMALQSVETPEAGKKRVEAARQARIAAGVGAAATAAPAAAVVDESLTAADIFTAINGYVGEHPELVDKVKTVFQFHIKSPDSDWYLDLKNGKGECKAGVADKADVTLEVGAEHLPKVMGGDIAVAQKLFFGGQLKISGNIMASNKLTALQAMEPSRVEAARKARVAGGQKAAAPAAAPAKATKSAEPKAPAIFEAAKAKLGNAGAAKSKQVIQFKVTGPDTSWVVDFSQQPAKLEQGSAAKADAVITLADDALAELAKGVDARELYQHGKLDVVGDVSAAHHLDFLKA